MEIQVRLFATFWETSWAWMCLLLIDPKQLSAVENVKTTRNWLETIRNKDIIKYYRFGKKNSVQANDVCSIHAKLSKQELKNNIIATFRSVKPDKFFFNENLSPIQNSIMYLLRKPKKDFPKIVSDCNSIEGSVCVWINSPNHGAPDARDSKMRINDHNNFNYFCTFH